MLPAMALLILFMLFPAITHGRNAQGMANPTGILEKKTGSFKGQPSAPDSGFVVFQSKDREQLHPEAKNPVPKAIGRTFSQDQEETLVAYLRYYSGKEVTINAVWGNQQASRYAAELKEVFQKAGWKVNGVNEGMYDHPVHGIVLSVPGDSVPKTAYVIWRAFTIIGVHLTGNKDPNQHTRGVTLIIGSKEK